MCVRLWYAPRIFRKFAGQWKCVLQCYGCDEKRSGYHHLWFDYFRGILAYTLLGRLSKDMPL